MTEHCDEEQVTDEAPQHSEEYLRNADRLHRFLVEQMENRPPPSFKMRFSREDYRLHQFLIEQNMLHPSLQWIKDLSPWDYEDVTEHCDEEQVMAEAPQHSEEYLRNADRLHRLLIEQMENRPPPSFERLERFSRGDYEKEKAESKVYGIGYPDIEPF